VNRGGGPLKILGRNFRGDVEFSWRRWRAGLFEDLLAVAFAVGPCGVEEIAAEIDGALQGVDAIRRRRAGPSAIPTCRNQFR